MKPDKPCSVCEKDNWYWMPESTYGGPGHWECGTCHPNPVMNDED